MKKILPVCLYVFMLITLVTSCKKSVPVADNTKTIVLPVNGQAVVTSSNSFAFKFLKAALLQDSTTSNKLISPLSIYLALSMVYNGAAAATKDSIAATLELSGLTIGDLNAVCNSLISQLPQEDNLVQFSIANSIWYNGNSFQPLPSFVETLKTYYSATAQPLDFNDASSVNTINNWVALNTSNKIPKLINHISPEDLMYLVNAIYFNGKWQFAFKTSDTRNDNFYCGNGSIKPVPFMQQKTTVNIFADSLMNIIELPYGGGKSYSMYIAMPANQQQPVSTFASLMSESVLRNAINEMHSATIQLSIPKWEYSYSIDDMKPALTSIGMGIAFTSNADFSYMYNPAQITSQITKAIHKTYIKVSEEGTEAAAATAIGVGYTSVLQPLIFKADHPFVYIIIEKQTGAILFSGIINDPSVN